MSTQKNLITLCFAAVCTLGLAACGGDGAPVTDMTDDAKTPTEPLAAAQADYDALTDESTDEDRAAAVAALEGALMLAGNEDAYVTYLEEKVATAADTAAAATAAKRRRPRRRPRRPKRPRRRRPRRRRPRRRPTAAEEATAAAATAAATATAAAEKATAAAKAAEEASDMAKAVILAIKENTLVEKAPEVTLAASSAGMLTAQQDGYTMSAAPEEITGWRGRTLEKDGDTTVIYTNIADAVAKDDR